MFHKILNKLVMDKLETFGAIPENMLDLMAFLLTDRKQYNNTGVEVFDTKLTNLSVPYGNLLAPFLFNFAYDEILCEW